MKETMNQYRKRRNNTYRNKGYIPPKDWNNANLGKRSTFNRKMNLNRNKRFPLSLNRTTANPVLAQRFMNNFKANGILSANYQLGHPLNMIRVHRAYYGRLPSDPIEFTPHHGKALKNSFRNVFGFGKGRKLYNAALIVHYPSKINTNKFLQPGNKYFQKRNEYRKAHMNNAIKTLRLQPPKTRLTGAYNLHAEYYPAWDRSPRSPQSPPRSPSRFQAYSPRSPVYVPVSPPRSRLVNTANKLLPILSQYGTVIPAGLSNLQASRIIDFARQLKNHKLNNSLLNAVYFNANNAKTKIRNSRR